MVKREYNFYVYIVASSSGTLYIGVTNNIIRRVVEHRDGLIKGFSKKYSCHKLVYYEYHKYINNALEREKELKKWRREKKENLIRDMNPHWNNLYQNLF